MRNCCRKLLLIIQIVLIPALLLSGCADLKISKALVQHAVGGIYDPTGGRASSFQMHGMILTDRFYRFSLRGISVDTKNPDNVGIWALFLLQVDQPTDYAYCVAGEDDMVGIYVDLPAEQFDYEVTG